MDTVRTKDGTRPYFKVYKSAPPGMPATHKDQINADLLAVFREEQQAVA